MLAKLGLMQGAPAAGGVQVGELCAAAVVLVEGTTDEADSLLELMAEEASQSRILDAVLAVAEALTRAQPALLDEAAAEAAVAARQLGEREDGDALAKGTAGVYALAVRTRARLFIAGGQPAAAPVGDELARVRGELESARRLLQQQC